MPEPHHIPVMIVGHIEPLKATPPRAKQALIPSRAANSTGTHHVRWRRFWLKLHLYVGLCAGGLFVLSSLTGSLLVFYKTIDEWLNPEQLLVRPLESFASLDQIVATAKAAHPAWPALENLTYPLHSRDTFQAWFRVPTGTSATYHWQVVTIDPYSGRVLGERQWGDYFVSVVYELHKSLLLEDTGETIVGVLAGVLLLSVGTGIYLWWPAYGNVRRAFSFQSGSSIIRRQYDLHKLSGISSALFLLMLAGTGFYLVFPNLVTSTVRLFPRYAIRRRRPSPIPLLAGKPIGYR